MFEKVFAHVVTEHLLAEVAGNFLGAVIPEGDVLLAIDEIDADGEFRQHSAIDFLVFDHCAPGRVSPRVSRACVMPSTSRLFSLSGIGIDSKWCAVRESTPNLERAVEYFNR